MTLLILFGAGVAAAGEGSPLYPLRAKVFGPVVSVDVQLDRAGAALDRAAGIVDDGRRRGSLTATARGVARGYLDDAYRTLEPLPGSGRRAALLDRHRDLSSALDALADTPAPSRPAPPDPASAPVPGPDRPGPSVTGATAGQGTQVPRGSQDDQTGQHVDSGHRH